MPRHLPSVKSIESYLGPVLKKDHGPDPANVRRAAEKIRAAMEGVTSNRNLDDGLKKINELLGGHGIEALRAENHYVSGFFQDIVLLYINMGDTYNTTVRYDTDRGSFSLGSWGDWVAGGGRRYRLV